MSGAGSLTKVADTGFRAIVSMDVSVHDEYWSIHGMKVANMSDHDPF